MKKYLLTSVVTVVSFFAAKLQAQCDLSISNIVVQIVGTPVTLGPNKCQVSVNVQFDLAYNSGSKFVYFHSYLLSDYPNPSFFNCSGNTPAVSPPTSAQLGTSVDDIGKSFLDVGLDNSSGHGAVGVPVNVPILTTYTPDTTVVLTQPSNSPGLTVTKTFTGTGGSTGIDHFIVQNLNVIFNQSCSSTIVVKTDAWASNSNAASSKAQCYICGVTQYFNDPSIIGFKNCNNPRQYALGITTVDPTPKNIVYKVYIDMDDDGSLNTVNDVLAFTSDTITISSSSSFSTGGPISLPAPYSNTHPYSEKGYLILVEGPTLSNSILGYFPNPGCIPLPVTFAYFNARRTNSSNVSIDWQTASEVNSSGFAIERKIDGGWEQVAFIPSQAIGGNSSTALTYHFNDLNNAKGISQYRIQQVDLDGKYSYSEIRAVRGEGQPGKTIIYPNPSSDGSVNVVFDDVNGVRDISLIDMGGRIIKKWIGVTNNNLHIENLSSGIYGLQILIHETGMQTFEKIVVNKR